MTSAPDNPTAWFEVGQEDLEMARRALMPPSAMPRSACYHAQQAAEKYLKAFLVSRRIRFPRVHDLDYLLQLCVAEDGAFSSLVAVCEVLNEYGVPMRYPDEDSAAPDKQQGEEALKMARQVAAVVHSRVPSH